ncbi:MAG: hypothetical protein GY716_19945 [bacterium]|nr:hypothetical protein [bacterium]
MNDYRKTILCCLLGALLLALPAAGEPVTIENPDVLQELGGIRKALDRLVGLLETAEGHQRVELLLKRIDLKERRLIPREQALEGAQEEVRSLELEAERMEQMLEEGSHFQIQAGMNEEALAEMERQVRAAVGDINRRMEGARARAQRLDNEVAEGRDELEDLDDMLMDLLEP